MLRDTTGQRRPARIRPSALALLSLTLLGAAVAHADDRLARAKELAQQMRGHAYAPYSRFAMGAVVVTDRGVLVPGTLVENVSLGLAMCAERVALFSTVAQAAGRPEMLVLAAPRTGGQLTLPCGACLQVARELGGPDLHVEACDPDGTCQGTTLGALAPRLPHKTK